ncbi:ABC transporter substrate-binding protein [Xylocopilactobacillus apicola]|uniref:Spermidine/putrescine ABC transporter substrate-binding protein n=1 Tax=Xylocopilactobacillus apicola TaxID=2932184 RepID=A0AAU9DS00_9LACO|nr:ABC transporter substrate-binding protein [Xylocopilactobacillus apicola]BDR58759.1 spermidine/putrescine ABC transporter substrate-binding protein [Xylocopilactobacillus apicola]
MKKILSAFIAIVITCGILIFGNYQLAHSANPDHHEEKVLNLFNWGDYIDPKLVKKFERTTGYKVTIQTFDSNESMIEKIRQGGISYDLTVPSEYMVEKMKNMNLLIPIDLSRIHNQNNIDPEFMNRNFDPHNQYSLPYFWGTLGIVYNDKYVKPQEVQHWQDLWDPKFKNSLLLIDSVRDIFAVSLITMDKSINTKDYQTLLQARDRLVKLTPNVKAIVADEIKMYMEQEESYLAVDWSGEAREMMSVNPHLHYVVPNEGSNIWLDNFVIPRTAKHFDAIYKFLNFMNEPENAAQNTKYVGYSTPNRAAKKNLPRSIVENKSFYPAETTMEHLDTYRDLGQEIVEDYNDLYLEFKMSRQ